LPITEISVDGEESKSNKELVEVLSKLGKDKI
jgi:hypothetical protein